MIKEVTITLNETRGELGEGTLKSFMGNLMNYLKCTFDLPKIDGQNITLFILESLDDEVIENIINQCMSAIISGIDFKEQESILE